jgi:hypothetical protein
VCTAASPTDYRGAWSSYITKPMSARASIELLRQLMTGKNQSSLK